MNKEFLRLPNLGLFNSRRLCVNVLPSTLEFRTELETRLTDEVYSVNRIEQQKKT